MSASMQQLVQANLAAVSAKRLDDALAGFAPDGELIDPHYPVPQMRGHAEIAAGLRWVFASMRELHFVVDRCYVDESGTGAAAEVTADHVLAGGRSVHVQQTFVVDTTDGLITRWQAYQRYGPHGIAGLVPRLSRLRYDRYRR